MFLGASVHHGRSYFSQSVIMWMCSEVFAIVIPLATGGPKNAIEFCDERPLCAAKRRY